MHDHHEIRLSSKGQGGKTLSDLKGPMTTRPKHVRWKKPASISVETRIQGGFPSSNYKRLNKYGRKLVIYVIILVWLWRFLCLSLPMGR